MKKLILIKDWIIKNKYLITVIAFIIWTLLIDSNSMIQTIKYANKVKVLEKKIEELTTNLELLKAQNEIFTSDNKEEIEKYAREELNMKENDEDVFIVEE
jgi:cell division protein FtsB